MPALRLSIQPAFRVHRAIRGNPGRLETTTTYILTPSPRSGYRFPHDSAPSGRSQRAGARAARKAISYHFRLLGSQNRSNFSPTEFAGRRRE